MSRVDDIFIFEGRNAEVREQVLARLKSRDEREDGHTGLPNDGREPFLDAFESRPDEDYIICLAHGIVDSWMVSEPFITKGEYFIGYPRPNRPIYEHFSNGIIGDFESSERAVRLKPRMRPLTREYINQKGVEMMGAEAFYTADWLWWVGGYQGHTVPSYDKLFSLGIGGTLKQIDYYDSITPAGNVKKKNFYKACRIIMEGMSAWFIKYADAARKEAEATDLWWREELLEIAATCERVSTAAPATLREAGQLMWGFCLWDWVDCIGRFDQYMYPFYDGTAEHKQMIADLVMKFWEHGVHNLVIGGVKPDGTDGTNDISYLILQIIRANHGVHPRVSARIHENTPAELLDLIVTNWSEGMSDPAIASDKNIIEGLVSYGVSLEDARNYTLLGCQEIEIPGKSNFGCEDGSINLAMILQYTLNHGRDPLHNGQVGLDLGGLCDYKTFDELWKAYTTQVEYITRYYLALCNLGVDIRVANVSKLVKSCMTEACVERGLDLDDGGSVYNYGCIETGGHGAVGDSLYAMKKLVYDEKKISLETLDAALKANFEGYEEVRQMLLAVPKYGNDDDGADEMASRVLEHFWTEIGKYNSRRGQPFTGACSLLGGGNSMGQAIGALPDGRRAGEPLGNTIGPRTGSDKSGLTAMLSSVAKMPLKLGVGGTTCNVLIPKDTLATPQARSKVAALMKTFMLMGGQLAQITTASLDDMLDAQEHPEDHENLIVRVGGFSSRFIDCQRDTQDEIIKRYEK